MISWLEAEACYSRAKQRKIGYICVQSVPAVLDSIVDVVFGNNRRMIGINTFRVTTSPSPFAESQNYEHAFLIPDLPASRDVEDAFHELPLDFVRSPRFETLLDRFGIIAHYAHRHESIAIYMKSSQFASVLLLVCQCLQRHLGSMTNLSPPAAS